MPKEKTQKLIKLPEAWRMLSGRFTSNAVFLRITAPGQVHGQTRACTANPKTLSIETAIKAHCCQSPIVNDAKLCVLFSYTHVMAIKITSVTVQLPLHPLFYGFRQWKRQSGKLILEIFSPFNPETFRARLLLLAFHLSAWCRSLKLCLNIISEVVYRATIGRRQEVHAKGLLRRENVQLRVSQEIIAKRLITFLRGSRDTEQCKARNLPSKQARRKLKVLLFWCR